MDGLEQIEAFGEEMERTIAHFQHEFDLPPATMVGVLHIIATRLSCEQFYDIDVDDDDWDG